MIPTTNSRHQKKTEHPAIAPVQPQNAWGSSPREMEKILIIVTGIHGITHDGTSVSCPNRPIDEKMVDEA